MRIVATFNDNKIRLKYMQPIISFESLSYEFHTEDELIWCACVHECMSDCQGLNSSSRLDTFYSCITGFRLFQSRNRKRTQTYSQS